eukprot:352412-Chlamydomonas_euryale.AAC.4
MVHTHLASTQPATHHTPTQAIRRPCTFGRSPTKRCATACVTSWASLTSSSCWRTARAGRRRWCCPGMVPTRGGSVGQQRCEMSAAQGWCQRGEDQWDNRGAR